MIRYHSKGRSGRRGFTIVEIALVILISGVLLAAGTDMLNNYIISTRIKVTRSHMAEIDQAIAQYIRVNGKLPCVADLSAVTDNTAGTYGVEYNVATGVGNCTALTTVANSVYVLNSSRTDAAFLTATPAPPTPDIAVGAVPTRSLDIPDQDMVDGWGNRFTYVVTMALASPPTAPATWPLDFTMGAVTVVDSKANPYVSPPNSATYLVISYADGIGAYMGTPPKDGTAPPLPCSAATSPPTETNNCAFELSGSTTNIFETTTLTGVNSTTGAKFNDYVSVGTANSGTMSASVQVLQGTSVTSNNPIPNATITTIPAPFYIDCQQGYIAVACSGVSTTTTNPDCPGIPNAYDNVTNPSIPVSACQYGTAAKPCAAAGPYNFFTTCVRF